ncbi:transcription cofactor vestigial-like protein 3 [Dreissena polymorpha]|uniref:transcription cofactor vestigial-like protein 3 n=1 Tax=Dreissena polymorpha TaxID=45954 RepID=UPI0022653D83|nr:transcription cofactor vestigial-like protein 3 [Dreissena polymorpha]
MDVIDHKVLFKSFLSLCLPKTKEPLDLGLYPPVTRSLGHALPGPNPLGPHAFSFGLQHGALGHGNHGPLGHHGNIGHRAVPTLGMRKVEEKSEQPKETQYLSANCVLMVYYNGDISSNVDEHFSRALSQPSSYSPEGKSSKES